KGSGAANLIFLFFLDNLTNLYKVQVTLHIELLDLKCRSIFNHVCSLISSHDGSAYCDHILVYLVEIRIMLSQ
uniref:Uncharacterized protein n=1 Tax=Oryza brachyantha TaxID=4533 RepID=J3KTY5_ORYBR